MSEIVIDKNEELVVQKAYVCVKDNKVKIENW